MKIVFFLRDGKWRVIAVNSGDVLFNCEKENKVTVSKKLRVIE